MAVYKAIFKGVALGERCQNVLHVSHSGSATSAQLAGSLRNAWQTNFLPNLSEWYEFSGVEVYNIDTDDVGGYAPATVTKGAVVGDAMPSWACVSVRWNTTRRGRAGQGRTGFGPIPETAANGNVLSGTAAASWTTKANQFITDIASSGSNAAMLLAVVSYEVNGAPRATPLVSLVTGATVNNNMGSRLSRHPGR